MNITAAIVLFTVIWFMVFFVVLPLRPRTQGEAGAVVPGTHSSAPADPQIGRKVRLTTLWAVGIFAAIAAVILTEVFSVRDLDFFGRMSPAHIAPLTAPSD